MYESKICAQTWLSNTENTETYDDKVISQYKLLPYPHLGEDFIFQEENYYKDHTNKSPMNANHFRDMKLNDINHYLFKGSMYFG